MAVNWNDQAVLAKAHAGTNRGLARWITEVERRAVELIMSPPKSGRVYRRRGVSHQASAPGEAPANDLGRLVNSRTKELFPEDLRARLTFRTEYAAYLEFGTRKMEPRPYANRALRESKDAGLGMVREELAAALR